MKSKKKRSKKNLYNAKGEPARIRCYMFKQDPKPFGDYITVVYTHAHRAGYPKGKVLYRSMNDNPFHPSHGIGLWGEGWRWDFKAGGSRVSFSDLPKDCQEIVLSDYKELWQAS